jgi:EEF1A lysine methyltransferase 4
MAAPAPQDWASVLEPPGADGQLNFVPRVGSAPYTRQDYWEFRFAQEDSHEWLCGYAAFRELVHRYVPDRAARILLVGTGNCALPMELADDGYARVTVTDYSVACVERMRAKTAATHPGLVWEVADMTRLAGYADGAFDAVLDKAAMDAILADGGDSWDPPEALLATAEAVVSETARVLAPGGVYLQLTFSQPHFRRRYLQQAPGRWAASAHHAVPAGFGYFLFAMTKPQQQQAPAEPATTALAAATTAQ